MSKEFLQTEIDQWVKNFDKLSLVEQLSILEEIKASSSLEMKLSILKKQIERAQIFYEALIYEESRLNQEIIVTNGVNAIRPVCSSVNPVNGVKCQFPEGHDKEPNVVKTKHGNGPLLRW